MTYGDDLLLAKRAAKGDEAAFETIVLQNQTLIYNLCLSRLASREDALDVSQDTFLKAYRSIGAYRGESKLSSWLYRICLNCITDHQRRHTEAHIPIDPDENGEGGINVVDESPDSSPEKAAERADVQSAVRAAVAQLPHESRDVLILREFEGMSYDEIAATLDIEVGTVKSRLNRAKQKLKEILTERNFSP